jgi:hypothetical protein
MILRWYTIVFDSHNIRAQSRWWAGMLDWKVVYPADDEIVVVPQDEKLRNHGPIRPPT